MSAPFELKARRAVSADERCRFRPLSESGLRLVIRLTYRCDLACPHCLAAGCLSRGELTISDWRRILRNLPGIGVRKVLLTGGEPLLYANVAELTRTIADQGVTVDLNSNLQRMDDRMLADLQAAGLSEISASIEGPEAIHDRMHGRVGAYRRTVAAIRKAADRGIRVDVSCCVTADNVDHLGALVALLDSLPIASLTVSRLFPIGHGLRSSAALTAERLRDIHRGLATHVILARRYPIRLVGLLGLPSPNDCDRGRSLIGLSPLGELQACVLCAEHPALASRPLESGLDVALQELRENVALHSYPLCCREEP